MPRILQNETNTTLVLFGGKIWLHPKGSKDTRHPDRVEVKTEVMHDPMVKQFVAQRKLSVLSLEAAKARQDSETATMPVVEVAPPVPAPTPVTPVTASAPAPVAPVVESTPAAVGTVEDEKSSVEASRIEEPTEAKTVEETVAAEASEPKSEDAPRHGKKGKKHRG